MMTTQLAVRDEAPVAAGVEEFEVLLVSGDDPAPGYSVFCLALPGCASQGDDWDDALAMITEAIELSLEFPSRLGRRPYDKDAVAREWESIGCTAEFAVVRVQR